MGYKLVDITGNKYGKLTVSGRAPNNKYGHTMWECRCDCGKPVVTAGQGLKSGNTTSCGCSRIKDISGQRFGMLTAIKVVGSKNSAVWRCVCDCGNERDVRAPYLQSGQGYSCGCTTRDGRLMHGMSHHYLYGTYISMRQRCECTTSRAYPDYGGRGIKICDRWMNGVGAKSGFECFLEDMGDRPEGMSIDRVDANKGYEPDNCRWATHKEQSVNRRSPKRNRHVLDLLHAVDRYIETRGAEAFDALRRARAVFQRRAQTYTPANDNVPAKEAA